jgi:hypothetical protein
VKATTDTTKVWDAINVYVAALESLSKRRFHGHLMNADWIDAQDAAAEKVDEALSALASTQSPTPAAASEPHAPVLTDEVRHVLHYLSIATDEGDDIAAGTHYIRDGRIHCKGSFLDLIERARVILAAAPTATGGAT